MKVSAQVQAQVFRGLAGGLPYPLALQLVADEEAGGRNGTLHQIEQGVRGEFVIIGEHSGLRIVTDPTGMITATLHAVGRSGRAAYPWRGDNALIKLQRSAASLLDAYPPATEEVWRTTVNLARIQARNQIPHPERLCAARGRSQPQPLRADAPYMCAICRRWSRVWPTGLQAGPAMAAFVSCGN